MSGFEILQGLFHEKNRHLLSTTGKRNLRKIASPLSYSANFACSVWKNCDFAHRDRESLSICEEVTKFVRRLLRFVADKESFFESRFMLVGSAKENTKINKPGEFDFDAKLEKLSQCRKIVHSSSLPEGFVHLIKKPNLSRNPESENT